ncbi:High affinity copper uptake protein 1 [Gryllus bimaculatus]|nr:High affinity copper uptake protein 1 [Gryllus bimaculatus]
MHVSFWFDTVYQNFLFKGFNITSTGGLIGTCLGLASLASILEVIKVYRASIQLKHTQKHENENENSNVNTSESPEESVARTTNVRRISINNKLKYLSVNTSWYTLQDTIGYIVMLAVMTFNGYFTIAVILGSAFGYLVFGPWLMEIKLKASTVCSKQQKCSTCIAKMERSHLLSSSSGHIYNGSTNDTNSSSLMEVAEGLASVMQSSSEERVAVEVHSQEHCT